MEPMDITRIIVDEDRGQVTVVVHDPISDQTWGVFPEPDEQGPQRADESNADYKARIRALIKVLKQRAVENPAPGVGQPKRVKAEPVDLMDRPIALTDDAALDRIVKPKAGDQAALDAFREARRAERAAQAVEVKV
jgi:hypothetical protein